MNARIIDVKTKAVRCDSCDWTSMSVNVDSSPAAGMMLAKIRDIHERSPMHQKGLDKQR